MSGELQLEVVTPERVVLRTRAEFVALPGLAGEFGVLRNHAPLIAGLGVGVLRYGAWQGEKRRLFISGGCAEVSDNRVVVMANAAETAEEIDIARARAAKERAERRLRHRAENIDLHRAELALQRALHRLRAAQPGKHQ